LSYKFKCSITSTGAQRLIACKAIGSTWGVEASGLKFLHADRYPLGFSEGSSQIRCLPSVEMYHNQSLNHYVLLKFQPGTDLYFLDICILLKVTMVGEKPVFNWKSTGFSH